jgi:16S rRNA processing protein RimM
VHDGNLILKFAGVDSISAAEELSGADVCIPFAERRALEAGEFFVDDLVGCEIVEAASGTRLGVVTAFLETGGPGLLEVDGSWMIPFARPICIRIEPESRRIGVELPEGLKELNAS